MDIDEITKHASGKRVSRVLASGTDRVTIHFTDDSLLVVERMPRGLAVRFVVDGSSSECPAAIRATPRQCEYLEYIEKYVLRFGVAPAASDIERHFLVSAPTVNQMMQRLERFGFITRRTGVARSIRIAGGGPCEVCGGRHPVKRQAG